MADSKISAVTLNRLAKLLPRLASEHDGEVVNTVRAIGRTLAAEGLDWHALAGVIQALPPGAPVATPPKRSPSPSASRGTAPFAPCSRPGMRLWDTQRVVT
jgi:hypothetical protein